MKLFKLFCQKTFVDTVKTKVDQSRNIGRAESMPTVELFFLKHFW